MPRQRKPQNGGQRFGTGRVANTTTGSTTTQTVYRIPTGKKYGECDVLSYEVIWTSPINVAIEWSNIYRISLDSEALKQIIENYESLDLSNVTLQTVNGNVEFTGSLTVDWTFTWTSATFDSITSTTGEITTLTWTNATITNVSATDVSTGTLEASWNASVWGGLTVTWSETVWGNLWVTWTLDVDWDVDFDWNLVVDWTTHIGWNVSMWEDLTVTWATTTDSISATTWTITTLASDTATIGTLEVTNTTTLDWTLSVAWTSTMADVNATNVTASWTLAVTWTSSLIGDVTMNNVTSTGSANLNNVTVGGNETIAWTLAVTWATTLNNTLTVAWTSTLSGTTSVGGNLSVAWNQAVSWTSTVSWNAIFSQNVSITWNESLTWNLIVDWNTEFKWDVDIDSDLNVDWTTHMSGSANVDHVLTVGETLTLWANATAPQFILQSEKNQANWVAALNASGKLDNSVLPPLSIWETYVVSSEAQMLALTAQRWDIAIRTDETKTYIKLNDTNPSTTADWQQILSSGEVISVNWQTGAVALDADDIPDLWCTNQWTTNAEKASWNNKEDASNKEATTITDSVTAYPSSHAVIYKLQDYELISNKDTGALVDSTSHYPSSHVLHDQLLLKQDTLVSGANIKTINNMSLLWSGNITIQGWGGWTATYGHYETTGAWVATYQLLNSPVSDESFMVYSDSGTAMFPTIDYTYNNSTQTITFNNLWANEKAIIWVLSAS